MNDVRFALPNNGYDIIEKIMHAYVLSGQNPVTLDDVAKRAGMDRTQVSANHAFLVSVGVLAGSNKKHLTGTGNELALAISNKLADVTSQIWATIMQGCDDTRKALDMIRVQNGIKKSDIQGRLLNALGMASNPSNKTGVNCLVDVFQKANLICEKDGMFFRNDISKNTNGACHENDELDVEADTSINIVKPAEQADFSSGRHILPDPSLHIDVQIHIDANATPEQIDQIFASMSKHLYGRG